MIQIIFLIIGIIYLVNLVRMSKTAGSHLGLDAEALAKWQGYKRKQYAWMIAAGWGALAVSFVAAAVARAQTSDLGGQIAGFFMSLVTMVGCYSVAAEMAKKAKAVETGKTSAASAASGPGNS